MAFDRLAWKYDDLFSRSRIGIQRGAVWEVLADTFLPGDTILALNCSTKEERSFLALLGVCDVACGAGRNGPSRDESEAARPAMQLDLAPAEHLTR